jgi:hypothetical protein
MRKLRQESQNKIMKPDWIIHMEEMDELLGRLLGGQLKTIGFLREKDADTYEPETKTGMDSMYKLWLCESLEILKQRGYIKSEGNSCILTGKHFDDIDILWKEWEQKKRTWMSDSNVESKVVLAEAALRSLPDILNGEVQPTDIMFPNSSMDMVEGKYKHNIASGYFNEVLADVAISYIEERIKVNPSAQIRIIEIGAGTGGTSALVLGKIRHYENNIKEYCYTDISKRFNTWQRKVWQENPFLTCRIFNVDPDVKRILIGDMTL